MKKLFDKLSSLIKERMRDSFWTRIALVLSIIVVFCTTYALVLPALTLTSSSSSSVLQEATSLPETMEDSVAVSSPATDESLSKSIATDESPQKSESSESQLLPSVEASQVESSTKTELEEQVEDSTEAGTFEQSLDDVEVKVDFEKDTFSEAVSLQVIKLDNAKDFEGKIESLLGKSNQSLTQALTYDISFINKAGKEVEPNKEVNVSILFKDAVESTGLELEWKLYHFVNNDTNKIQDITEIKTTDINQDESENVVQVDFKADNFSAYTIAGVSYEDFTDYINAGSFQSSTVETITSSSRSLKTDLKLSYEIPKTALNSSRMYAIPLPDDTTWAGTLQENTTYIGKDVSRDAYNYKFVQQDGKKYIVIEFLESYVSASGVTVKGDIVYTASVGQDYRQDNGDYKIPFTDSVTITVPSSAITKNEEHVQVQYDLSTSKTAKVVYDGDQAYLDYTVTVYSNKGTKDSIKISDILTAQGLTITSLGSVSVVRKDNMNGTWDTGSNYQNITAQVDKSSDNKSFDVTLPKLEARQAYTLTYRYTVGSFSAGQDFNVKNKVQAESPDVPPASDDKDLTLHRNKVTKSGSYNADSNKITWTITVNANQNDIAGAVLTDDMLAQASNIKIEPSAGAIKTSAGYTFSATSGGKNTNTYTITYTTDAPAPSTSWGASSGQVKNIATLTDNGEPSTATATVGTGKGDTGGLSKTFEKIEDTDNKDLKELSWKSTIELPGDGKIPAGTEFEDALMGNNNNAWDTHYFTRDQIDAIYQDLVSIFGVGNFEFSIWESGQSTWQYSSYSQISSDKTYRKFKFKLTKDYQASKDITLSYTSTGNVGEIINFDNTISSSGFSSKAEYRYEVDSLVTKMDGTQNTSDGREYESKDTTKVINEDGTIDWVVKVALDETNTSLTVVDTPPSGLELVEVKYGVRNSNQTTLNREGNQLFYNLDQYYNAYRIIVDGQVNSDGSITLNFNAAEGTTLQAQTKAKEDTYGESLYIWYTFKSNDAGLDETVVKAYTNNVSTTIDGRPAGKDDHTQTVTIKPGQKVSKNGEWNNDNRQVDYSVTVNPKAQDLAAGGDSYVLTDTLTYQEDLSTNLSYDLKRESVKLLDANNQEVSNSLWSWTVEKVRDESGTYRSILKVTVPNNQKFILQYSYAVSREVASDYEDKLTVKNTAEIQGFKTGKTENAETIDWKKLSTSGTAETARTYKITKVDVNNFAIILPNAIFEVIDYETGNSVATYKTAADGTLYVTMDGNKAVSSIGPLAENKMYYIVETTAPDGYSLPKDLERYYFYYADSDLTLSLGSRNYISEAVNLKKQSKQEYVTNEELPPTTSITVNKKWQNEDGSETNRTSGEISVTLKRISNVNSAPEDVKTMSIKSDGGQWTATFDNLPVQGDNGEYYSYFVEEAPVSGYTAIYSNSNTSSETPSEVTATSDTITITNKANKQYALPKTGGSGVKSFVIAGITISGLAALLLLLKSYKNQEGNVL